MIRELDPVSHAPWFASGPGILDDFFRHFPIRHIFHRHSDQDTVVPHDQFIQCPSSLPGSRRGSDFLVCHSG